MCRFLDKQRALIVDCRLEFFRYTIRLRSKYIAPWFDGVMSCIGSILTREMNFSIPGVQEINLFSKTLVGELVVHYLIHTC